MVNSRGAALVETVVLTPAYLIVYWCVAAVLNRYGVDRDVSQFVGLLASFFINLPVYCAMRPFLVQVEAEKQQAQA
jgi:hypothetical protein